MTIVNIVKKDELDLVIESLSNSVTELMTVLQSLQVCRKRKSTGGGRLILIKPAAGESTDDIPNGSKFILFEREDDGEDS